MALFGKNKSEEDDYEKDDDLVDGEGNEKKLTRKFRDLNSGNKKKRKEPPKLWGKRERLMLLILILTTVLISGILTLTSENNKSINLPKLNFNFSGLNFDSLTIFKEETITIKKGSN